MITYLTINERLDTLSPNALRVLAALLDASDGNGDDFGLMCAARESIGMEHHAFAGHVAHLQPWIEWTEDLATDPGVQCSEIQYGLTGDCLAARVEIVRRVALPVDAHSLEDELRAMVVRLEASAQRCGDGAGGLARASALAQNAAELRGLLTRHGHDCEPCKVYDNAEDALEAMASIDG